MIYLVGTHQRCADKARDLQLNRRDYVELNSLDRTRGYRIYQNDQVIYLGGLDPRTTAEIHESIRNSQLVYGWQS